MGNVPAERAERRRRFRVTPLTRRIVMSRAKPRESVRPVLDWQDAATVDRVRDAVRVRARDPGGPIRLVQTHISTVFLTPRLVFKFKRPVDVGFADFRSLGSRRHFCLEELRLNRRLAPDVYLGVETLRAHERGFTLGRRGAVVDYAVLMKRLPDARMLNARLRAGDVRSEELDELADVLARFHTRLRPTLRRAHYGGLEAWHRNWEENFAQTRPEVPLTLSEATHRALQGRVTEFLRRFGRQIQARVEGGFVRNGHGDLRCEHICLDRPVRIIDCVEFNERFRFGDVGNDLAFLLMDLSAHGAPQGAQRVLARYVERTGDAALPPLIPFYGCYRAFVRGKVLGMRLRDHNLRPEERRVLESRARDFFVLAEAFARQMGPPVLLLVAGLMGSGKSTLAAALAERTGVTVLSSDRVRKELAAAAAAAPHPRAEFAEGLYAPAWTERTYQALWERARTLLAAGQSVIVDASFIRREYRHQAFAAAAAAGAEVFLLECVAPEALTLERLRERERQGTSLSDGRADLYPRQKAILEPITEVEAGRHVQVRTDRPVQDLVAEVLANPGLRIPEPPFGLPAGAPPPQLAS